jgi:hypothetical protein
MLAACEKLKGRHSNLPLNLTLCVIHLPNTVILRYTARLILRSGGYVVCIVIQHINL